MKNYKYKTAATLVQTLIVVAIIALLTSMVIGIAAGINNKSKEQLAEGTIAIVTAALGQFRDYGYRYKDLAYADFDFPLDCNDFLPLAFRTTLESALGLPAGSVVIGGGVPDPDYSGSEVLYFFLSQVPTSRKTLDKIDSSLITNEDADGNKMKITVVTQEYPLLRIIDPWGETLRYDYYDEKIPPGLTTKRNFPVITSAGRDRIFGTADDISSR